MRGLGTPGTGALRLGEFVLGPELGEGGSSTVYAALAPAHGEVALKVLHEGHALSERERRRFFEEIERMRRVRHPCLVALVDAGVLPDGRPFLCMPRVRGETVASRARRGPIPLREAVVSFSGLAEGVAALHRAGLVHRDIKPENVILDAATGRAVLLDFGIAREIDGPASTTTRAGALRGTRAYMAPERFFGAPASIATDVYELAVVLYVMLVGAAPWDADCPEARLNPATPSDRGVKVPAPLATVLMKALSTRPEARPPSASAFDDEVRRAAAPCAGPAARPRSASGGARARLAWLGAVAAVAAVVLLGASARSGHVGAITTRSASTPRTTSPDPERARSGATATIAPTAAPHATGVARAAAADGSPVSVERPARPRRHALPAPHDVRAAGMPLPARTAGDAGAEPADPFERP